MSPFDAQRLTPLMLDETATRLVQSHMIGGALTRGQIDAIRFDRLTAWIARLFHR